jgi:hypothetical protein
MKIRTPRSVSSPPRGHTNPHSTSSLVQARCREESGDKRGADEARERAIEVEASFSM